MKNTEIARNWLRRAVSNLEKAKAGRTSEAILYEDLCFDCQQAAEKALKALLFSLGLPPRRTHSLGELISLVESQGLSIPDAVTDGVILSEYAVETRYPGEYEPVTADEYAEAVSLAEVTVKWVSEQLALRA